MAIACQHSSYKKSTNVLVDFLYNMATRNHRAILPTAIARRCPSYKKLPTAIARRCLLYKKNIGVWGILDCGVEVFGLADFANFVFV
jgi:hypothetical protein